MPSNGKLSFEFSPRFLPQLGYLESFVHPKPSNILLEFLHHISSVCHKSNVKGLRISLSPVTHWANY